MIITTCPICNFKIKNELLKWRNKSSIYICNNCNLIFSFPLPLDNELLNFYQGFLHRKPNINKISLQLSKKKKEIVKLFNLTQKSIKGKSFLDYGGGTGIKYQAAKELGLDTYFQEIDEESIDFVKKNFGIEKDKILKGFGDFKNKKFDYILCDNVIEHVKHPIELINNLFNFLKKDGTLIIKTPNARNTELIFYPTISIQGYFSRALKYNSLKRAIFAYFKRFWACDPPRHLYSFSKPNFILIAKMLKIHHFTIEYYHVPLLEHLYFKKFKRRKGFKRIRSMILFLPILIIELLLKNIQLIMRFLGLITPGGIILKIKK